MADQPKQSIKPGEKTVIETASGKVEIERTETGIVYKGLHPSDANEIHMSEEATEIDQMAAYKAAEKEGVTPGQYDAMHAEGNKLNILDTAKKVMDELHLKLRGRPRDRR